jgi:hypothetical protein
VRGHGQSVPIRTGCGARLTHHHFFLDCGSRTAPGIPPLFFDFLPHVLTRSGSCQCPRAKEVNEVQRIVEMLIGRLITDEQFRSEFLEAPEAALSELCNGGLDLSRTEIAALIDTDPLVWVRAAEAIDPRLQKASLKNAYEENTHV